MKRILVLRGGALGDFIVTLPALRLLRNRWPAARIELAGNVRAAELGKLAGVLDAVHSQAEARWAQLYQTPPLAPEFQTWLDDFDLIVSFWPDRDGDFQRHFAQRGPAFVAGHASVSATPAAAHFCATLQPLGLTTDDYSFRLDFPAAVRAEAVRKLGGLENFIAVHPGSGSPLKNWPAGHWAALAKQIDKPLLIVTGEAETDQPRWPKHLQAVRAHNWPLPVLGAALARSAQFIGHDSGISHLAAAAGTACVLLFGPTDPAIWAPPGTHVLKNGDALAAISVDEVLSAVNAPPSPATAGR